MSTRHQGMIDAFVTYELSHDPASHQASHQAVFGPNRNLIGMPLGTRLLRIYRRKGHWQIWLSTNDYVFGTYLNVHDDGMIENVTDRCDEGPEVFIVRPTDEEIRNAKP